MFACWGQKRRNGDRVLANDRWERLFEQLEADQKLDNASEDLATVEQIRMAEIQALSMIDRLRAHLGEEITVHLESGSTEIGVLEDAKSEWIQLSKRTNLLVVPTHRIIGIVQMSLKHAHISSSDKKLGNQSQDPSGEQEKQLMLERLRKHVSGDPDISFIQLLRKMSQARSELLVLAGNFKYFGIIEHVAKDHIDIFLSSQTPGNTEKSTEISRPIRQRNSRPVVSVMTSSIQSLLLRV